MANKNIFCNTPWYEAHIYWDGSLGICCDESRKLYDDNQSYNIKTTSLLDWFNSSPVKQFRKSILAGTPTDICKTCYHEERHRGTSRRHRANQKSVIFTKTAFDQSYLQSPGNKHFEHSRITDGHTNTLPIDLHIDLGNYCNLACKICWSGASTTIATQYVRWGYEDHKQYLGTDWTKDPITWNKFLNELLVIPKLKNIHFMGGETLITKRFENFVDFMIEHGQTQLSLSFVTNGMTFNEPLLKKLKKFTRVGIEISIETTTEHNNYVRQGTDTNKVLANIEQYQKSCQDTSVSLTIRPTINALTIGYYYTLLEYCLDNKLLIKSNLIAKTDYLNVNILPTKVKQEYIIKYHKLLENLSNIKIDRDFNESDSKNYAELIKLQVYQAVNLLSTASPTDQSKQLAILVEMCGKWDKEYKFDAIKLYPELVEEFKQYGY